jgi:hypothetical protein
MTDDQLRALIRESVARHLAALSPARVPVAPPSSGLSPVTPASWPVLSAFDAASAQHFDTPASTSSSAVTSAHGAVSIASAPGGIAVAAAPGSVVHLHVSHATFNLPTALDGSSDGPCVTEPHAGCTSCGFCQSLGY